MAITVTEFPSSKALILCHPEFLIQGGNTQFVKTEGVPYAAAFFVNKSLWTGTTEVKIYYDQLDHYYPMATTSPIQPAEYGAYWDENLGYFMFSFRANADLHSKYIIELTFEDAYFAVFTVTSRNTHAYGFIDISDDANAISLLGYWPDATLTLVNELTTICDIYDATVSTNPTYIGSLSSGHYYTPYNYDYEYKFNLSEFFHRCLAPETIKWLDYYELGIISACEKSIKRFDLYLKTNIQELYPGGVHLTGFIVARGGTTKRDYLRYEKHYFANYPDDVVWRLTNYVTNATEIFYTATKKQKLYSNFVTIGKFFEPNTYKIWIHIVDENDATDKWAIGEKYLEHNSKYTIAYNYIDADIEAIATMLGLGAVKSFYITIQNSSTYAAYIVDFRKLVEQTAKDLFFVFENSLGGWQTLSTFGENTFSIDITKAEYPIEKTNLQIIEDSYMVGETIAHNQYREAFTGWIDGVDKHGLLDFLNSENVYVQDDRHEAMRPIKILSDQYTIEERNNNGIYQYGYTFKYIEAVSNKHITDIIAL
jgi:hypothetical protein